jgi:hypothetical protein
MAKAHLSTVIGFGRPVIIGCSYTAVLTIHLRSYPESPDAPTTSATRPPIFDGVIANRRFHMSTTSAVGSIFRDRRRLLTAIAMALGLIELADAPTISFWEGALAFGILYLAGAQWTRRGGVVGPILVGALSAFEIQGFFQWARGGTVDWVAQISVLVLSTVALVVALAVLKGAYDARTARRSIARADA